MKDSNWLDWLLDSAAMWVRRFLIFALILAAVFVLAVVFGGAANGQTPVVLRASDAMDQKGARMLLGWTLFCDPILSADGSTSCMTCHDPKRHWTDGRMVSEGMRQHFLGQVNAPTIENSIFKPTGLQFRDGRADNLLIQATLPIENPLEMGPPGNLNGAINRIAQIPSYRQMFVSAYGQNARINRNTIGRALIEFEGTVVAHGAPVDFAMLDFAAGRSGREYMTEAQIRGYEVFRRNCQVCHSGPTFSDGLFHNTGVKFRDQSGVPDRRSVTQRDEDTRAFQTPSLRNCYFTAPYMHDGRAASLDAVLAHYATGGSFVRNGQQTRDPQIDPRVANIRLNASQTRDLKDFLVHGLATANSSELDAPMRLPR